MRLMMEMSKQLRSDTILTGKGRKGEACEEYIERCQEEQHVERNEKMQEEPSTPAMNTDKSQQDDEPTGLYVIGGSPIGSNFIMYPGSALVFYGPRKSRA
ncbi:hypothetical protein AMTR_s00009p00250520 [Amborella trichopoda]|uniref:Uncharacterized protein n=2 Tax=Amborella trichopoda TaxID=13333 RepID=W1NGY3_AMBTC|nr:hypothetical protein AMTR_s00009p00250520 [Amborella trichopoda]